ncbi:uncharacterized protein VTP21DRAFT_9207 [Calcarisporiella thermophila]|uniref:uncharacterized protein n=1 Tax=Calcarisporiella thermophila TaxID=911321 RepID=UPI0037423A62
MGWIDRLNQRVAKSVVGCYFKLRGSGVDGERNTTFITELRAGLATFVTMSYIIAVNPAIISDTGGTCVCTPSPGGDRLCVGQPQYEACVYEVRKDLITSTAAISGIASILVGLLANLPLGLAPGMGLNAYFTYTVVGFHGSGKVSYQSALTAIFLEGIIFMLLTFFGIRQYLVKVLPNTIKNAMSVGVGFFLAHIGLQRTAGIGLVGFNPATLVGLAGCPPEYLDPKTNECMGHTMESPTMWLGILGFAVISILMMFRVKGAALMGILLVSIISWPRNTPVTYFPNTELGDKQFEFFKQVVTFHPIQKILSVLSFSLHGNDVWVALITFLYVDILEATSGMYTLVNLAGFVDEWGDFPGSFAAFMADGLAVMVGAFFGTSPVTAYGENGVGIAEGGKTGLTAITIGIMFFLSIFLAPIFASFPPWATGPALVIVGSLMCRAGREINWEHIGDAIPSYVTIALMPLTYSIAYGVIGGVATYVVLNVGVWAIEKLSCGKMICDKSNKEPWLQRGVKAQPPWYPYLRRRFIRKQPKSKVMEFEGVEIEIEKESDGDRRSVASQSSVEKEGNVRSATVLEVNADKD